MNKQKKLMLLSLVWLVLGLLLLFGAVLSHFWSENSREAEIPEEIIPLVFEEYNNPQTITELSLAVISTRLDAKVEWAEGVFFFYHRINDQDSTYAGFEANDGALYHLGEVGMYLPFDHPSFDFSAMTKIVELTPFGYVLKVEAPMGANYLLTNYYMIVDGKPEPLLQVDGGAMELDVTGNGHPEIITQIGTMPMLYIYHVIDHQFSQADVTRLLSASTTYLVEPETRVIEAGNWDREEQRMSSVRKLYQIKGMELHLVKVIEE